KKHIVYMHRQIMDATPDQLVDHEDGDGLNNRRSNLRVCGSSHNLANRPAPTRAIPYRGVYPNPPHCALRYRAQIKAFRHSWHLGSFATQEAAAIVYDRAALHFFGSFARLNFPDQMDTTRTLPLPNPIARMLAATQVPLPLDDEWTEDFPTPPAL